MAFRFTTVAIAILLIGGGIAAAVAIGDDPAAPISRDDRSDPDDRANQIEEDLDAALRQGDDLQTDDAVEDTGDDTTDDDTDDDTNDDGEDSGGDSGGSNGSGGSGEG